MALGGGGGSVGGDGGHVREEGPVGIGGRAPDEVSRLSGEHVGEVVLGLASVGNHLAVLVDLVVVRIVFLQLAVPLVPAGRDVGLVVLAGVSVHVLAEVSGPVAALFLQADGDRVLLVPLGDEPLEAPVRRTVAQYAVVVVVEAGEKVALEGQHTGWLTKASSNEAPCSANKEPISGICWTEA